MRTISWESAAGTENIKLEGVTLSSLSDVTSAFVQPTSGNKSTYVIYDAASEIFVRFNFY